MLTLKALTNIPAAAISQRPQVKSNNTVKFGSASQDALYSGISIGDISQYGHQKADKVAHQQTSAQQAGHTGADQINATNKVYGANNKLNLLA